MSHMNGDQGHPVKKWWRKYQDRLKKSQEDRSKQFANYLTMMDRNSAKRISLKRSMVNLGDLKATSGRISSTPSVTRMSTIIRKDGAKLLSMSGKMLLSHGNKKWSSASRKCG